MKKITERFCICTEIDQIELENWKWTDKGIERERQRERERERERLIEAGAEVFAIYSFFG